MKIAFRHVPFTPAQRAELDEMARAGGYETLWYADGATPQAEELKEFPTKQYWPELAKCLEKDDLKTQLQENRMDVLWN